MAVDLKMMLVRGPFLCTPEHGVDMAYFVSVMELAVEHDMPAEEIGYVVQSYAQNRRTLDECIQDLQDFIPALSSEEETDGTT